MSKGVISVQKNNITYKGFGRLGGKTAWRSRIRRERRKPGLQGNIILAQAHVEGASQPEAGWQKITDTGKL